MSIKLGAVTGVVHHARGVLAALRIGKTVTVSEETLEVVRRDPLRLRDLHHHAQALEDYVRELEAQVLATSDKK